MKAYMAQSFNNLAQVYQVQGKYDQADDFYKCALKIAEKTLDENTAT